MAILGIVRTKLVRTYFWLSIVSVLRGDTINQCTLSTYDLGVQRGVVCSIARDGCILLQGYTECEHTDYRVSGMACAVSYPHRGGQENGRHSVVVCFVMSEGVQRYRVGFEASLAHRVRSHPHKHSNEQI